METIRLVCSGRNFQGVLLSEAPCSINNALNWPFACQNTGSKYVQPIGQTGGIGKQIYYIKALKAGSFALNLKYG